MTGDHKGVSSYLFERAMQRDKSAAPGFVAAFSQGNMGDVTPNVEGAWCDDGSGQQCSFDMSTCNGNAAVCHGRGVQKIFFSRDPCSPVLRSLLREA